MKLDKRNMQISILEMNREGIITFLNKLLYLADSRLLRSQNVHIAIQSLKTEYGS